MTLIGSPTLFDKEPKKTEQHNSFMLLGLNISHSHTHRKSSGTHLLDALQQFLLPRSRYQNEPLYASLQCHIQLVHLQIPLSSSALNLYHHLPLVALKQELFADNVHNPD